MNKEEIKIGDKVFCGQGTKSGTGIVKNIYDWGAEVEFPEVDYPASMCVINGTYIIPFIEVLKVIK